MHDKAVIYSAIALTFGLGLAYPAYAQDAGGAVSGATDAIGGATKDVTGAVGGAAGAATDTVTGATGDVTADKGGQNDVGKGQIAGEQKGGQGSGQATFGNLIAALNNVSAQVQNVRALENVNAVDVVDADNLLAGNNVQALNNALNRNDVDINVLREAINDNNVLNNALQNANVAVTDVVAVEVLSGGDIVVFTR